MKSTFKLKNKCNIKLLTDFVLLKSLLNAERDGNRTEL